MTVVLVLSLLPLRWAVAQSDTVYLKPNQYIFIKDTLIFGIDDSVVVVPEGLKYRVGTKKDSYIKLMRQGYGSLAITQKKDNRELLQQDQYLFGLEGKTIEVIELKSTRWLESSKLDTIQNPTTFIEKLVDKTHKTTWDKVIRKNLRFKVGDKVDPEIIIENERVIRGLPYIYDARILVDSIAGSADKVRVIVVTRDIYPVGVTGVVYDYNHFKGELYTRNFLGSGNSLSGILEFDAGATQELGYGSKFHALNISGSFIDGSFEYRNTDRLQLIEAVLNKPFITNDVKYGGELRVNYKHSYLNWTFYEPDSVYDVEYPYRGGQVDVWAGRSIFYRKDMHHRFFNVSARYWQEQFEDRPEVSIDSNTFFHTLKASFVAASWNNVRYFKARKLMNFGVTEDVPYGHFIKLNMGVFHSEFLGSEPYSELSAWWAKDFKKMQYMVVGLRAGGRLVHGKAEDFTYRLRWLYASPLLSLGAFEVRNFFYFETYGIKDPYYLNYINFGDQIRGLRQREIYGLNTISIRYEPFIYTPYQFLGFNIALSLFADTGWIGQSDLFDLGKKSYGAYGAGIHVKNEGLAIPQFSVEVGYMPAVVEGNSKLAVMVKFTDRQIFRFRPTFKPGPSRFR